jgi:PKD repeat protein
VVTLTLTDTNACNSPAVLAKNVNYTNNVISASFPMPDTVCPPYTHAFAPVTTGATSYLWNFGDGSPTSTLAAPTHTYSNPGIYIVSLIIANPNSCNKFDSTKQTVVVAPKITADFTFTKTDTCDPYIIAIVNNSTLNTTYPGAIGWTTHTWNYGDGTTSIGANPGGHTYTVPGTYTITLSIKDSTACNSPQTISKVVSFIDNNVRAKFEMPDTICLPYTHNFANTSVNVATYLWNFGDGNTSTGAVPSNTYTVPGTYTITLYTYNPTTCNKVDSAKQIVYASPSPTANFVYSPNPPLPMVQEARL